jgi:hypothetical protein
MNKKHVKGTNQLWRDRPSDLKRRVTKSFNSMISLEPILSVSKDVRAILITASSAAITRPRLNDASSLSGARPRFVSQKANRAFARSLGILKNGNLFAAAGLIR